MGNKKYNMVKIEIPVAGEYILTILEHMLIIKCIADKTYQYSEFINIENKYIMSSVNCRTGNIIRIMEEFCKSHNCPKKVLREELSKAKENINQCDVDMDMYDELKEESKILIKQNEELYDENCDLKNQIESLHLEMDGYNKKLEDLTEELSDIDLRNVELIKSLHDSNNKLSSITNKYNKLCKHIKYLEEKLKNLLGEFDISIIDEPTSKWTDKDKNTGIYMNKAIMEENNIEDDSDVISFLYEKIKSFMDIHTINKPDSKCLIEKFYTEFNKSISNEEFAISYDMFADFLKDIYSNNESINIEDRCITNIIFTSNTKSIDNSNTSRKSSTNIIDKSNNDSVYKLTKEKTYTRLRNTNTSKITANHGKKMLELWKTMTAKQIAERYPMYTIKQISNYCSRHSTFVKRGIRKDLVEDLKSYNGTLTLKELSAILDRTPSNIKRICETRDIPYKKV